MAKSNLNLTDIFTDTANAIRGKTKKTDGITPVDFADEISGIKVGGVAKKVVIPLSCGIKEETLNMLIHGISYHHVFVLPSNSSWLSTDGFGYYELPSNRFSTTQPNLPYVEVENPGIGAWVYKIQYAENDYYLVQSGDDKEIELSDTSIITNAYLLRSSSYPYFVLFYNLATD